MEGGDLMALAAELGAAELVVWSAYDGYDYPLQVDYDAGWGRLVEGFRALEESLGEGLESGARYQALGTALTRFEDAVLASLRVTRESLRA